MKTIWPMKGKDWVLVAALWVCCPLAAICIGVCMKAFALMAHQDPGLDLPPSWRKEITINANTTKLFEDEGVVLVRGAFTEWVDYLRRATDHQMEHSPSLLLPWRYRYFRPFWARTNTAMGSFVVHSALGQLLAQVSNTENVRYVFDFVAVDPFYPAPIWHLDYGANGPLWNHSTAIRWWLPLDACGHDGKGINEFVIGSHRLNVKDSCTRMVPGCKPPPDMPLWAPALEPGDVLIWNGAMLHKHPEPVDAGKQRRVVSGTVASPGALFDGGENAGLNHIWGCNRDIAPGMPLEGHFFPQLYPPKTQIENKSIASNLLKDTFCFSVIPKYIVNELFMPAKKQLDGLLLSGNLTV